MSIFDYNNRKLSCLLKQISKTASLLFYGSSIHDHWIYEKLHRPSSYFHATMNLLYYYMKKPRVHRVLSISIEPVYGCNLNCDYCWRNLTYPEINSVKERQRFMDLSVFKKIVDELPFTVETLVLSGLGEPLLHPDIFKMIEYGAKAGLRISIYTNGTLLHGDILDQLAVSPIAVVNISLEPDIEKSMQYRGIDLEELSKNILMFSKKKRPETELKFSLVAHEGNYQEIYKAYEMWGKISNSFKVTRKVMYEKFVGCDGCLEPWLGNPMVLSNGDVSACCHTFGWPIIIGNITQTTFSDIINSQKHQAILESFINKRNIPQICNYCSHFAAGGSFFKFLKHDGKKTI